MVPRPELGPLTVDHVDVVAQDCERKRVERQEVLCGFGLAVQLDDLAIDDDPSYFDLERAAIKATALRAATAPGRARAGQQTANRSPSCASTVECPVWQGFW